VKGKFAMAGLLSVSLVLSGSLAYAQGPAEAPRPIQKGLSTPEGPITTPPRTLNFTCDTGTGLCGCKGGKQSADCKDMGRLACAKPIGCFADGDCMCVKK